MSERCLNFENYETATVAMWLDNVALLKDYVQALIPSPSDDGELIGCADWLKDVVTATLYPGDAEPTAVPLPAIDRDIVEQRKAIGSLWRVNWLELAFHYVPEPESVAT